MFLSTLWKLAPKNPKSLCVSFCLRLCASVCVNWYKRQKAVLKSSHQMLFQKTYFRICWWELLHSLCLLLPTASHCPTYPNLYFLNLLNLHIGKCWTGKLTSFAGTWKFSRKDTDLSFQCSWIILFIMKTYIVTYSKPRPFSLVHHWNVFIIVKSNTVFGLYFYHWLLQEISVRNFYKKRRLFLVKLVKEGFHYVNGCMK